MTLPGRSRTITFSLVRQALALVFEIGRFSAALAVFLGVVQAAVPIVTAWVTKGIFDSLTTHLAQPASMAHGMIWTYIGIQVMVSLLSSALAPVSTFLNAELTRKTSRHVQVRMLEKADSLQGLAHFESPEMQDRMRLIAFGAQMAPLQLVGVVTSVFSASLTVAGFAVLLFGLSPLLGLLIFLSAVPQIFVQARLTALRIKFYAEANPRERYLHYLSDQFTNPTQVKELKLYGYGQFLLSQIQGLIDTVQQQRRQQDTLSLRWTVLLQVPMALFSGGAFVLAITQVIAGRFTIGDIAMYTVAVVAIYSALASISSGLTEAGESLGYLDEFQDFLATPQLLETAAAPVPVPPLIDRISIDDVSFRYSDTQDMVLENVSLDIRRGQSMAIVGLNGAGKSTLIKLLTRMYDPTAGRILWDGIDVKSFDVAELRGNTSVVFQDFVKLEMTAAVNIGVGQPGRLTDLVKIRTAAQVVGIDHALAGLSNGYDTLLSRQFGSGVSGVDLSGGQWQKVAIARSLMNDSTFLILDEPSAALDPEAEVGIFERIREFSESRTVIVVTHRLSIARMMHMVAVLDGGRLVELGSHDTLMTRGGKYAELFRAQAEQYQNPVSIPA